MTESPEKQPRVVYSAIFGGYDTLRPVRPFDGCDFVCFTDDAASGAPGWQIRLVPKTGDSPALLNRQFKMLPHRFLPEYTESLYVDGRVDLRRSPRPLFDKYLGHGGVAIPLHLDRDCAFEEAMYCVKDRLIPADVAEQQMASYAAEGFPRHFGLTENNIIFRRHHEAATVQLMEAWWSEYLNKARRDQVSLPYLSWKLGMAIEPVVEGPRLSGRYFSLRPHEVRSSSTARRLGFYLQAYKHRSRLHRAAHTLYATVSRALRQTR